MALDNVRIHTSARRLFVLVVDSDERRLDATAKLLDRFQYKVFPARTAAEALETATVITPVLIVTAQKLEGGSGLDVITTLKKDPGMRSVPIIVLSDRTDPAADRACLSAGAATCLSLPVSVEDLYRVIQVAIEPVPRMNLRIRTKLPVAINGVAVDSRGEGSLRDLSEHGIYVRTDRPYPLKTVLPVQIQLGEQSISVQAEVIYCRKETDGKEPGIGIGMQFVDISRADQMRIRMFIRDDIAKALPAE